MQENSRHPTYPKPWYYQDGYIHALIIFWPLWSILILRSPWHTRILTGGIAWAILFIGSILGVGAISAGEIKPLIVLFMPGVLMTVFIQVKWASYKRTYEKPSTAEPLAARPTGQSASLTRRSAARRRSRRRSSR